MVTEELLGGRDIVLGPAEPLRNGENGSLSPVSGC
jgi:hypothetical protein